MLVLTQSRGAYLGVICAIGMITILRWPRLLYGLPLLVGGLVAAVLRFGGGALLGEALSGTIAGGIDTRLEIWSRAMYAISDFPFTGIGIGTFARVIPLLYPYFLISPDIEVPHAHNVLLQVAVDLGLPGLVNYLAIHIIAFVVLIATLRSRPNPLVWALTAGTCGSFIVLLVHGLIDAAAWEGNYIVPWLLFALTAQLGRSSLAPSESSPTAGEGDSTYPGNHRDDSIYPIEDPEL